MKKPNTATQSFSGKINLNPDMIVNIPKEGLRKAISAHYDPVDDVTKVTWIDEVLPTTPPAPSPVLNHGEQLIVAIKAIRSRMGCDCQRLQGHYCSACDEADRLAGEAIKAMEGGQA